MKRFNHGQFVSAVFFSGYGPGALYLPNDIFILASSKDLKLHKVPFTCIYNFRVPYAGQITAIISVPPGEQI